MAASENVKTPNISQRAAAAFKKKFGLLGKANAHQNIIKFLNRLSKAIELEKEKNAAASAAKSDVATESQYHAATGSHLRNQTAWPASITPSKSFGGVRDTGGGKKKKNARKRMRENISHRLDSIFSVLGEEVAVRNNEAALAAERGQFIVDGEVAIGNHADILKILVMWLAENRPEVAKSAVDSIADMVRSGTVFRG